jgi:hypothetical protein
MLVGLQSSPYLRRSANLLAKRAAPVPGQHRLRVIPPACDRMAAIHAEWLSSSAAGAEKLEFHATPFLPGDDRTGFDVVGPGKVEGHVFADELAFPRCLVGLKDDSMVASPLALVVMNLAHRSDTHEMNRLAFGVVRKQAGFLDRSD